MKSLASLALLLLAATPLSAQYYVPQPVQYVWVPAEAVAPASPEFVYPAQPPSQATLAPATYLISDGDCCGEPAPNGDDDCAAYDLPGDCAACYECCPCCPLVPNMLGADSLGIPYDNFSGEARLTFQHFIRVADNNSPLPRDRVAIAYKQYYHTQIVEGGNQTFGPDQYHEIQEYRARIERTILDGLMSVEAILPWAYTTDSTYTDPPLVATPSLNLELGNVGFGFKGLLWQTDSSAISAGLLVEAPTADARIRPARRLADNLWYFTPYLAYLWQPGDNWFVQGFNGVRMADRKNREFGGTNRLLEAPDLLTLDLGVGYIYATPEGRYVRAVTPTVELHYTHSLESMWTGDPFNAYYRALGEVDFLTLTAGTTFQIQDNATLAVGAGFPLRSNFINDGNNFAGDTDRQFEWQLMIQANVFFR